MLDCPESGQPSTGMKKLTMPEHVRHRTMTTPSGIFLVWYRTKKNYGCRNADPGVGFVDADAQLRYQVTITSHVKTSNKKTKFRSSLAIDKTKFS